MKIPVLTGQQILDVGLNVFGLQLFIESIADKEGVETFSPISFVYKGVKVTFEPERASSPKESNSDD